MLEPGSRRLLLEALRPPDGHRLDWAVGTTYTLDLMALLTAPVAFAFSDWQGSDGRPVMDPLALLKAVRQYASKICLFCQAGKIHVPRSYQPLLSSLEDSVMEANAPLGGSFHPKMWFLRFVPPDDSPVRYRVLCASRNMTLDRSWDTLLCLDGVLQGRRNAFGKNHPLGRFVEALPQMCVRPLTPAWKKRLSQLSHEIRRVEFEIPEPFEEIAFHPLGLKSSEPWPFPQRIDRLFVISPFVDDGFIQDLSEWSAPMQLLSRAESLSQLTVPSVEALAKTWILDDTANPEPGEAEESDERAEHPPEGGEAIADLPLMGLHAKVYVADAGWNARVFTGSANATRAAFNRNVEFLVELCGKKSRCGVDAILGTAQGEEKRRASSLIDLLQPFMPSSDGGVEPAEAAFEREVDRLAKALSASAPVAQCRSSAEEGTFALQLLPTKPLAANCNREFRLGARPISLPKTQLTPVELTEEVWVEFPSVTLLGLTSFFAFEAESRDQTMRRRFVLNVPLAGGPQHRQEAILRELLSDQDRVLRFLLLLVSDAGARDLGRLTGPGGGDGFEGFVSSLFGGTLLESLVRALDRDPERLDQVAEVIRDLQQSAEGERLLPDDLEAIWDPILATRTEQLARKVKPT